VKHDVPGVPEERHVLVNRQLVKAVVTPAYLPLEVLRALILPRVNAAVPRQVYLVVPILNIEPALGLFKGKSLGGHGVLQVFLVHEGETQFRDGYLALGGVGAEFFKSFNCEGVEKDGGLVGGKFEVVDVGSHLSEGQGSVRGVT